MFFCKNVSAVAMSGGLSLVIVLRSAVPAVVTLIGTGYIPENRRDLVIHNYGLKWGFISWKSGKL